MNLKKSLIISIFVIAFVCLLTVNVNAVEAALGSEIVESYEQSPVNLTGGTINVDYDGVALNNSAFSIQKMSGESLKSFIASNGPVPEGCSVYYFSGRNIDFRGGVMTNPVPSEPVNVTVSIPVPDYFIEVVSMYFNNQPVSATISGGKLVTSFSTKEYTTGYAYIKTNSSNVVPAGDGTRVNTVAEDVFAAAKENGTPVTVSVSSLATWNFPSVSNVMAFNPNLTASATKMPKVQSALIENGEFIDFEHSGVLPGKATVTVNIGTERFGTGSKSLWVYYYNPENKGYEYVGRAAYANGSVTMELSHCSTYALIENELVLGGGGPAPEVVAAPAPAVTGTLDKEPKAGEMFVLPVAILSVISLGVVAIINKK